MKELLRLITIYLQLLQRKCQGKIDDKAGKYIHFAVEGAFHTQNLRNYLLQFSRVTTRSREPEAKHCEFLLNHEYLI